jgi:hypothetical protein
MSHKIETLIRDAIRLPEHVEAAAAALRYDLYHGPSFARLGPQGFEGFTADDYATEYADLEGEGYSVAETFGPLADHFRAWVTDNVSAVFVDVDAGFVSFGPEPEGHWMDSETWEPCDCDAEGAVWVEPDPVYMAESRDVVRALFGSAVAEHFN